MRTKELNMRFITSAARTKRRPLNSLAFMQVEMRPGYLLMALGVGLLFCGQVIYYIATDGARAFQSVGFLASFAAWLIPMVSHGLANAIVSAMRVSHQRRLPSAMTAQWLQTCLWQASVAWLMPVAGGVAAAWITLGALQALQIAALGSAAMAALTGIRLISAGMVVPVAWRGATLLLTASSIAVAVDLSGFVYGSPYLPTTALWALLVAWPIMGMQLLRKWRYAPLTLRQYSTEATPQTHVGMMARGASYLARFQPLYQWGLETFKGVRPSWTVLLNPGMFVLLLALQPMSVAMGEPVAAIHLGLPVLWIPLALATLSCRDVHWRNNLMPQGHRQRNVGARVVMDTLILWALVTGVVAPMAISWVFLFGHPLGASSAAYVAKWVAMPLWLFWSVAAASVIKALDPLGRWTGWLLGALAIGCIATVASTRVGINQTAPVLWVMDAYAALAMLVMSIAMVALANKLWSLEKLMQYAAKP